MFKFIITTEYSFVPIRVYASSYKIKRNFLTLNLNNNKKIVYNLNKLEHCEMEEIDDLDCSTK